MRNKPDQQKLVDTWNRDVPIGTAVEYWIMERKGPGRTSKTRSHAEVLSGHTAVV
jgi:hypothetical protein